MSKLESAIQSEFSSPKKTGTPASIVESLPEDVVACLEALDFSAITIVRISPMFMALWSETSDPLLLLHRDPVVRVICCGGWISSSGSGIVTTLLFLGAQEAINSAVSNSCINRTILDFNLDKTRCLDAAVDQFIGIGVLYPDHLVFTTVCSGYSCCGKDKTALVDNDLDELSLSNHRR